MARKHRLRALRNGLLCVLLLAFLWQVKGCPLPTAEMEFHRRERQHLADESGIVLRCESEAEGWLGEPAMLVGVAARTVHTASRTHRFNVWPKNPDGPTLVVLPSELALRPVLVVGLAAVEPPEQAETARLTLTLPLEAAYGEEDVRHVLTGRREGEAFLFRLQPQYDDATSRGRAEFAEVMSLTHRTAGGLPPYELAFFDSGGGHIASYTN